MVLSGIEEIPLEICVVGPNSTKQKFTCHLRRQSSRSSRRPGRASLPTNENGTLDGKQEKWFRNMVSSQLCPVVLKKHIIVIGKHICMDFMRSIFLPTTFMMSQWENKDD